MPLDMIALDEPIIPDDVTGPGAHRVGGANASETFWRVITARQDAVLISAITRHVHLLRNVDLILRVNG